MERGHTSTGLEMVALQETNLTRRFPTAAQIRLSLSSGQHLGPPKTWRRKTNLRMTNAT